MRLFRSLVLALLIATPAFAAEWSHYANARFGFSIDVPPGFVAAGEPDNGDGQRFDTPTARLTAFGANIVEGDFEDEVRARKGDAEADGWAISYSVSTPQAASFSGSKGARILYVRMIALCAGAQMAAFQLDYSRADLAAFDPIVGRLVRALKPEGGAGSC